MTIMLELHIAMGFWQIWSVEGAIWSNNLETGGKKKQREKYMGAHQTRLDQPS